MRKAGAMLILLVLVFSFVTAQVNDTNDESPEEGIDQAYQCLNDLLDDKDSDDLSLQEAVFSTLALGSENKLTNRIQDSKGGGACFGESSCTLKETAQVLLSYDRINKNTADIESWLKDKEGIVTELTWFLQTDISNHIASSCIIAYDGKEHVVDINEDMTIQQSSAGNCLSRSSSKFWLRVNNNCIDKTFRVSCDEDFITSLLYQRSGSSTIYVSSTTNSASALGTTEENINSKCFKSGSICDYEGTLWSALALDQVGEDISSHLPYLLALASENKRFFPSTFLYVLTQGNDQFSEIVQAQQQSKYWQAPATQYNRFYDTSLALLALQGTSAPEFLNSQSYLLDIQTPEGCWNNNNIRDTAFLLYSGWSKSVPRDGGIAPLESCEAEGFICTSSLLVCSDAGGSVLDLDCDFGVCCSANLITPTCVEQGGTICSAGESCDGSRILSVDTSSCCVGTCQDLPSSSNNCQLAGGGCFDESCTDNEVQLAESCSSPGLVCCKESGTSTGTGNLAIWISILLILILLVILGIIYRRKLQLWVYKFKNKSNRSRTTPGQDSRRPPHPPYGPGAINRPLARPMGRQPPRGQPPRSRPGKDKELDETLRKLREMSE